VAARSASMAMILSYSSSRKAFSSIGNSFVFQDSFDPVAS
jgi:hypothetical protein